MSSYEDRAREARAARNAEAKAQRYVAEMKRKETLREVRAEAVGDLAGGFGSFIGSYRMQTVISLIKTGMLLGFGAAAISALYKAL